MAIAYNIEFVDETFELEFAEVIFDLEFVKTGPRGPQGEQGPEGPQGEKGEDGLMHNDHAQLNNLSYDNAGHTGYQRKLVLDTEIGCYFALD